jgi:glycosyltransferase involved in cell wall biosynthesis
LSVLVLTKDEEKNLPRCLASVAWAHQVIVVDSFSADATERIAKESGAEFVQHPFESYARQRNWALETLRWRGDWILVLDADEQVPPDLRAEIEGLLAGGPAEAGFYVKRRVYFMGKWIRHCGWYPNWNLRLIRKGRARYDDRPVHEHLVAEGDVGYLHGDLIHDNQKGLAAFFEKHNRYATLEAQARATQGGRLGLRASLADLRNPATRRRTLKREIWPFVPAKPLAFFVYSYVLQRGFLDGPTGLLFCLVMAGHELHIGLKTRELRAERSRPGGPVPETVPVELGVNDLPSSRHSMG